MFSVLKKHIFVKKFYQTELYWKVRKHKKTVIRLYYLKSKNGEHRKNNNLSKLYLNLTRKWYFCKKNNIKLNTNWFYKEENNEINLLNYVIINSKIDELDIKWFY